MGWFRAIRSLRGVAESDGLVPDWRDAKAYEPLLEADRSLFAWEWLRRDSVYRAVAERACGANGRGSKAIGEVPERWGLLKFEPPGRAAPNARPIWCAAVHPYVLNVEAVPPDGGEVFDLRCLRATSTLVRGPSGGEHLLVSDGLRVIRIDVLSGTIARRPAALRYRIAGLSAAERPVLTLRRLLALWRTGRFCRSLHPHEERAKRWLLMLRVQDALSAGAEQRDIAEHLLSAQASQPRWRSQVPSLRSRAQRLVRGARHMASGRYRELLL